MSIVFNAVEIFSIGIQIEKNGRLFYQTVAEHSEDYEVKKLFEELADWETKHVELFEELVKQLPQELGNSDISDAENLAHQYLKAAAEDHIFLQDDTIVSRAAAFKGPEDALRMAIRFEKDSVIYYTSMKSIVREDLGKDQLDLLIQEEMNHIGQLSRKLKEIASKS